MSKRKIKLFPAALMAMAVMLLLSACGNVGGAGRGPGALGENEAKVISWDRMPEMSIDLNKTYLAKVQTNKGSFTIRLLAKKAPVTVNNFVFLVNEGFYEGLTFHNVIDSFMIQAGDPGGNGTGNAGYRIPDELDTAGVYKEGVVAMFNTGTPNSGSSQFFICTGPDAANLNRQPNYSIFGEVASGMDVIKEIAASPAKNGKPIEPVTIETITIEAQ